MIEIRDKDSGPCFSCRLPLAGPLIIRLCALVEGLAYRAISARRLSQSAGQLIGVCLLSEICFKLVVMITGRDAGC